MTGEELYAIYCARGALLPEQIRKNEALPAWAFLPTELKRMWAGIANDVDQFFAQ